MLSLHNPPALPFRSTLCCSFISVCLFVRPCSRLCSPHSQKKFEEKKDSRPNATWTRASTCWGGSWCKSLAHTSQQDWPPRFTTGSFGCSSCRPNHCMKKKSTDLLLPPICKRSSLFYGHPHSFSTTLSPPIAPSLPLHPPTAPFRAPPLYAYLSVSEA